MGSDAVPSAMILAPRVMTSAAAPVPELWAPLMTVPGSIVSVASLVTKTYPLSVYVLSAVQVVLAAILPLTGTSAACRPAARGAAASARISNLDFIGRWVGLFQGGENRFTRRSSSG